MGAALPQLGQWHNASASHAHQHPHGIQEPQARSSLPAMGAVTDHLQHWLPAARPDWGQVTSRAVTGFRIDPPRKASRGPSAETRNGRESGGVHGARAQVT